MIYDYHTHTMFSEDSEAPVDDMIRRAIDIGVAELVGCVGNIFTSIPAAEADLLGQRGSVDGQVAGFDCPHLQHLDISVQSFPQIHEPL